jgi:DinB superfamily
MLGRPQKLEAAPFYWKYIDRVEGDDPIAALERQLPEAVELFEGISEELSMYRYAPEKWSMREALSHTTDTERAFTYRALWFGRGFTTPLESFDDRAAAAGAKADRVPWAAHVEEFRLVRLATISLFRNIPDEAWMRAGVVSGNVISVRALAFLTAGHAAHHIAIFREKYLG